MSLSFKVRGTLYSFPDLERILSYRNRPLHGGRGLKHRPQNLMGLLPHRPLHGGRGLKLWRVGFNLGLCRIAPFTGGAD